PLRRVAVCGRQLGVLWLGHHGPSGGGAVAAVPLGAGVARPGPDVPHPEGQPPIAASMSAIIFSQPSTGSTAPLMICASVTPQKFHTSPISGMEGIGTASAPTSRKPAAIGSSETTSAAEVSAG